MTYDPPLGTPFAKLAAAIAPPYDEMLIALEREFRAVDRERVADLLDELARPLLALSSASARLRATAFALLGGLTGAWHAAGDLPRARRAAGLRLLLPLETELRARVLEESLSLGEAS